MKWTFWHSSVVGAVLLVAFILTFVSSIAAWALLTIPIIVLTVGAEMKLTFRHFVVAGVILLVAILTFTTSMMAWRIFIGLFLAIHIIANVQAFIDMKK